MLIGALLILTWVILLVRYPMRAVPISLGALLGLGLVAAWVIWQEQREAHLLGQIHVRVEYDPKRCGAGQPLRAELENRSPRTLTALRWDLKAHSPGSDLDLVQSGYDNPRYSGPGDLQPGEQWTACLPLPPLRPGYQASQLRFQALRLQGRFAD
ncbi:multidrug transporter [Stutzerimonas chloritidismutans]|uniref:multidrug transporter n=1 Tax=Stutzerimonas chloritidismutans TaxID=203192 RepID=UPI003F170DB5